MKPIKIDAGNVPAKSPSIRKGKVPPEKSFTFGLQYFEQIKSFGVGGEVGAKWFHSLLERLKAFSKEKVSRFLDDYAYRKQARIHVVNWDGRNVPISRSDLTWLPDEIRSNEEDFPIIQLQLSTGLGRLHGFFDSDYCFQIVLLDPMHNLQPSDYNDYKIRPTIASQCEFSALMAEVDALKDVRCQLGADCMVANSIHDIDSRFRRERHIIVAGIDSDLSEQLHLLCTKRGMSISEVIAHGIVFFGE